MLLSDTISKKINIDKLPSGKKSYALSFTLLDKKATLTDKQIEKIMEKLMKTYKEMVGVEIS